MEKESIIFFDGVCNLCNSSVLFIIKRDKKAHFRFASLQSALAKEMLPPALLGISSIVLLEDGQYHTKSSAALRIARKLDGLWPVLYPGIIIPRFIRDAVYNFIAANRYRWFGKRETCMLPTAELKNRFMDHGL
ncbi:thiol-disulfide oxidoreductase [Chitinophaga caeni]|uniref:Thiol-disulfide oxidoreductase n=1 Tax=Chitinophaga caeni TaxID=2029983 RepID=A0A291QXB4_9BACT|nr:DCC1-like thiol-disulfide oxidoreductase family protein [Chitinophaga caeni]ATL48580.1 thiol-disulfide oxidoreductase [Chitinophaga caeni]